MPFGPKGEKCFLLDFPLQPKKPCKIWMKKPDKSQRKPLSVVNSQSYAPDILTKVYNKEKHCNYNHTY